MIKSLSLLACFLLASAGHHVFAQPLEKLDYFVFLVTGKPTQGTAPEALQEMQAAHIRNFERLGKLGELSAAGPCVDPEKLIRGIVVINGHSLADAESKFELDPYVGQGFMKTEIHQYSAAAGKLVIPADTTTLDQNVIVIVSQGPQWPAAAADQSHVQAKLQEFAKLQHATGKLGFAALFGEQVNNKSPRVAVMIFRGDDSKSVEKLLEAHEMVKEHMVRVQVFAQYMVKDAMPKE